jgi:hypothetical protein
LTDFRAARHRLSPEAFHHVGRARVAAVWLVRGGADVVDVEERLEARELGGRERHRVDADPA